MKKTAPIFLLGILLFNWIGYQLFTSYLEEKANVRLEAQLDDNNYDDAELISIKIPATHLAYYNDSKLFERVNGQIEINGIRCNYVKCRLYNDSIEMLCIPNHSLAKVLNARDEFFKLVNDIQHSGQNKKTDHHSGSSKSFLADYYNDHHLFNVSNLYSVILKKSFHSSSIITFNFSRVIENPPEYC